MTRCRAACHPDSRLLVFAPPEQVGRTSMSWSGDGRLLAVGHTDGRVFVWDVERGRLASVLQGHTSVVVSCQFAPAGHLLATAGWDGTVRLWDATTGELLVSTPTSGLLGFSPDGRRLAFCDGPNLGVWDVAHGQDVRTFNPSLIGNRTEIRSYDFVHAAQFSPDSRLDGRTLITYSNWGLFRWPIRSRRRSRRAADRTFRAAAGGDSRFGSGMVQSKLAPR